MSAQVLQYVKLQGRELEQASEIPEFLDGGQLKLFYAGRGPDHAVELPDEAMALIGELIGRLLRGEKVAVLAEDEELSPNEAASILGVSRPLVVHRMDVGDLPFRYVGKHRRARFADVLALKARLDAQGAALGALADDAEDLERDHGL